MATGNNMKAHVATYEGFINMATWGSVAIALVVALVVFLIA
ncbi:MAG: Bacterial aa3 type cytochrome c oxidase subunit [Pseudomonadota bacterium]|jgi:hypothetical protein